jgi:uncharacterized protein HemX
MPTTTTWALIGVVLVLGLAAGGWAALRVARARFDMQLKRATEELHQRHAALADQLRAAQTRAQAELEQTRASFKRQAATLTAEPRAALQRTEERLKAAYAELDRLRESAAGPAPDVPVDGFAMTQPMQKAKATI